MDDTNVMIKCFIFSPHSVTWRAKLQYHAWDFNRHFLSYSIRCCCSIVMFFFSDICERNENQPAASGLKTKGQYPIWI